MNHWHTRYEPLAHAVWTTGTRRMNHWHTRYEPVAHAVWTTGTCGMSHWHTRYEPLAHAVLLSVCGGAACTRGRLISILICLDCLIAAHGTGYSCRNLHPLHAYNARKIHAVVKCWGSRQLGRRSLTWVDKTKVDFRRVGKVVNWVVLHQNRDQWWAVVNREMLLRVQ
jgi:hypothetical protein